jgi:hypothetical protein
MREAGRWSLVSTQPFRQHSAPGSAPSNWIGRSRNHGTLPGSLLLFSATR